MQKGLGIAALVIAIVAMFVPLVGTWLTVLVALLAAFAYGPGFAMAVAGLVIDIVHILFFSPLLWVTGGLAVLANEAARQTGAGEQPGDPFLALPWILIGVQVTAFVLLLLANKKSVAGPAVSA